LKRNAWRSMGIRLTLMNFEFDCFNLAVGDSRSDQFH
jgi:hypothetical protein